MKEEIFRKIKQYSFESDKCLVWTGNTTHNGEFSIPLMMNPETRRYVSARRVIWQFALGKPLNGNLSASCGNRMCVNPDHIIESSAARIAANKKPKPKEDVAGVIARIGRCRVFEAWRVDGPIEKKAAASKTTKARVKIICDAGLDKLRASPWSGLPGMP